MGRVTQREIELASLSLRTGQSEPVPGEAMLGFDLNCPAVLTDGVTTGVKQGVLTSLGCAHTTEARIGRATQAALV